MIRQPVSSSHLLSIGYDPDTLQLEVEFNDGSVYLYQGVPFYKHESVLHGLSVGQAFHALIKRGDYPYQRIS